MDVAVEHGDRAEPLQKLDRRAPSPVPQPHFSYTLHNGIWANTTIGISADFPLRSSAIHLSCSSPRFPSPPTFRFTTLTRPMKCTPPTSKLYQPAPLAF